MSLAGLAAAVSIAAAVSPSVDCSQALCGAQALSPFFAALAQAGTGVSSRTVHILDIGDSHSAGDSITGPWRAALQARFGSGGRGVLPPGRPFDGFLPHGVHVDQSAGWTVENTFRADPAAPPAFGVSGFRLTSTQDAAQLSLTAEPQEAFRRLTVCAEARPGAGAYVVTLGAVSSRISLDAPLRRIDCETFTAVDPQTQAALVTQGAPVTLTSWASFSDAGGVALSNLGVVGAELKHFARTDDQAVGEELRAYRPDLIVLEFGTNDGFVSHFSAATFESRLRAQIARLKQLSGGAPILILGAPDAETKRPDLRHNDDEGGPVPQDAAIAQTEPAAPAPVDEGPGEATIAAQADLAQGAAPAAARSAWYSPPALAQVREIQRRVALETGEAFWDWGARMGGPGAADRWANAAPPLTRADHVHTTTAGGVQVAAMLAADLDAAYAAWSANRPGP
jgi:lysophospholipase L1-like esterase